MLTTEGRRTRFNYASVDIAPEHVTPLYDNLLVRRIHDDEYAGILVRPDMQQTADGRWVRKTDSGPRWGVVVAAGRGDQRHHRCADCGETFMAEPEMYYGPIDGYRCPHCQGGYAYAGSPRIPMSVKVGDVIIYPRFESSHVMIRDEQFTFVHEADVMAVIE